MSEIILMDYTSHNPITMIGKCAGICYGSNTTDDSKNYKRGLNCLKTNHGRTLEFPQVYMVLKDYSAKVIREVYTAIGSLPTRLQESTRYIDYEHGFDYIEPHTIENNQEASKVFHRAINEISNDLKELDNLGIPREDSSEILPLSYQTTVVYRTNLRHLIDMSHQRLCTRAYWEYRELMEEMKDKLSNYDEEWKQIVDKYFVPKCEVCGFCIEAKCCGRMPRENDYDARIANLQKLKENN